MSDHSSIEWTEATWNPIAGCSVVSPGCTNCYAMRRVAPRLSANPATPHYHGTVQPSKAGPVWTGKIGIASDAVLLKPLSRRRPRMIFVNSTSDLFHEAVPDAVIDRIFAVMALCPQHTFQVLTKRPERMRAYLSHPNVRDRIMLAGLAIIPLRVVRGGAGMEGWRPHPWPLPNVWLGTSVEDQQRADERIPHLLATPAAVRLISAEPLLGPIDIQPYLERCYGARDGDCIARSCPQLRDDEPRASGRHCPLDDWHCFDDDVLPPRLDWVIVGGESGDGARPMHPDWARSLRDQCAAAGVPFFFKQWGEHAPGGGHVISSGIGNRWRRPTTAWPDGTVADGLHTEHGGYGINMVRVGTKAAGRLLDGVEHNAMPWRP